MRLEMHWQGLRAEAMAVGLGNAFGVRRTMANDRLSS
jgi:hypothetical protein